MSEKALFYRIVATLLEEPSNTNTLDATMIPSASRELTLLKKLLEKQMPSKNEYERTISGLPGACSLGLNVGSHGFLSSLMGFYESHGFTLSENVPADYLPAILEFLYWVHLNAPRHVAEKIEVEMVRRWALVIVEKILDCLKKRGLEKTFYYSLLKILWSHWSSLAQKQIT